jgi:hypothetical protein
MPIVDTIENQRLGMPQTRREAASRSGGDMSDKPSPLSREQQIAADFGAAMAQFRPGLADVPEGGRALDAMTEAVLRFGTCELRLRRVDRLRELGLRDAEATELFESALSHHERGLQALASVRPFVDFLAAQDRDSQALRRWQESSPQIRAEWRDHVGDLDVGRDDAAHLARIADQWCDALDSGGIAGLGRYLSDRLNELDEARRSPDRGTHAASFPWWKIVAAAFILGMTAYSVWILITSGAPWWAFWLLAQIACIMMLLVALGC